MEMRHRLLPEIVSGRPLIGKTNSRFGRFLLLIRRQWRKRHEKKKRAIRVKQLFVCSSILASNNNKALLRFPRGNINVIAKYLSSSETKKKEKEKRKRRKEIEVAKATAEAVVNKENRRTRSSREYEIADGGEALSSHVLVLLGEVVVMRFTMLMQGLVSWLLTSRMCHKLEKRSPRKDENAEKLSCI